MKIEKMDDLRGVRCDILGLGISNLPLAHLLCDVGAIVTVYDAKSEEVLGEDAAQLKARGVCMVCGQSEPARLTGEVIFRSPGIRPDLPAITHAIAEGAILMSEMELFCRLCPAPLFVITGSDGKTTTTTLTHLFLQEQKKRDKKGKAYVGGNIGRPLLADAASMTEKDAAVLELSSFQLMTMHHPFFRAAITNLTPNHLNWHTDMEEYAKAKENALYHVSLAVLNVDDPTTAAWAAARGRDMILFSTQKTCYEQIIFPTMQNTAALYLRNGIIYYSNGKAERALLSLSDILLPGIHNVQNYMTAIGLTYGLVDPSVYIEIARSFRGVPHRLELVRELCGVRYYNSSIDSSPTRTAAALSALKGEIVAICGGYDKHIPMEPLAKSLCQRVRCVVLTGATAPIIHDALLRCPDYVSGKPKILLEPDFAKAVYAAREEACVGESVLLSPACASFDAFRNFEERGNTFRSLVMSMNEHKN